MTLRDCSTTPPQHRERPTVGKRVKAWLRERFEWLVMAFLIWLVDLFEQRKHK